MLIDIICLIVLAYGFYTGFSRGIIKTIVTIITLTFGLLLSLKLTPYGAALVGKLLHNDSPLLFFAGFMVVFIIIMLLLRFIGNFVENIMASANVSVINNYVGGMVMALVSVAIYSVMLWFADRAFLLSDRIKAESKTYAYLQPIPAYLKESSQVVLPIFKNVWEQTTKAMDDMEQNGALQRTESNKVYDLPDDKK